MLASIIILFSIFGIFYPIVEIIYNKVKSKGKLSVKEILERIGF